MHMQETNASAKGGDQNVLLKMEGICKEFPGVKALDNVSLTVKAGTVHALMGENGAGKSTLMKCLFGVYSKDSGDIILEGRKVDFKNSKEALENGDEPFPEETYFQEELPLDASPAPEHSATELEALSLGETPQNNTPLKKTQRPAAEEETFLQEEIPLQPTTSEAPCSAEASLITAVPSKKSTDSGP